MEVDSLLKLASGGNTRAVEDAWMSKLESDSASPDSVVAMLPLLEALAKQGQISEATTLAMTAMESLGERFEPADVLRAAGPMHLALSKKSELGEHVSGLYLKAYPDQDGLEALIEEAGVSGGRPPRRALRTMDVCLTVQPGSYVAARHDDASAQVGSIDTSDWQISVSLPSGQKSKLGPVEFADNYAPVGEDDFRVLRDFDGERLAEVLTKKPAEIVVSIMRTSGNKTDSDTLMGMLCPKFIETKNWSRWWTKARTALKRDPHIEMEGRSPYWLKYLEIARSLEDEFKGQFAALHDAASEFALVDRYIKECESRNNKHDSAFLKVIHDRLGARAMRLQESGGKQILGTWLVLRKIEQAIGGSEGGEGAMELLRKASEPLPYFQALGSVALWEQGFVCLEQAQPDRIKEFLCELLLIAPQGSCNGIVDRLVQLGMGSVDFAPMILSMVGEPVECNEALLWLWDGPASDQINEYRLITVLTKMFGVLAEVRISDQIPAEAKKRIVANTRSLLGARKYERFHQCLGEIESGMASALATQIKRLDNLGRVVHEDMLKAIWKKFPELTVVKVIDPWADESMLLVTSQGMVKKKEEIDTMVNVTMRENAKRIGEAASHGDLSENSEYKFALEERDLLRARLAQMQDEMSIAQAVDPGEVDTNSINVGTKVELSHCQSGQSRVLTVLGPWDSNLERNIYNYKAPAVQKLMGHKVGDELEINILDPQGQYEIKAIQNALS